MSAKKSDGALRYLASTDRGYEKSIVRYTYIVMGRSTVEYAAAAWLPWASHSTMEKLEMCQRYARRAITSQIKTTPVKAILAEHVLPTVATRANQEEIQHHYDSAKATIRHATRGGNSPMKEFLMCME